jgi:hypothetical protein
MNDYGLGGASLGGASPGELSNQRVNGRKENESEKRRKEIKKFVKWTILLLHEPQDLGGLWDSIYEIRCTQCLILRGVKNR